MLNTERSYEINWKITCYRENTTAGAAIGGAAGYMIGGNAATTLGGAALGGLIGSQVHK